MNDSPKIPNAGSRTLKSPVMQLLRDEVFPKLSKADQEKPASALIRKLGISRQHFYVLVRGDSTPSDTMLARWSDRLGLKKSALSAVFAKARSARTRKLSRAAKAALS